MILNFKGFHISSEALSNLSLSFSKRIFSRARITISESGHSGFILSFIASMAMVVLAKIMCTSSELSVISTVLLSIVSICFAAGRGLEPLFVCVVIHYLHQTTTLSIVSYPIDLD